MSPNKLNWQDDGYYLTERRDTKSIFWVMLTTMLLNFTATGVKIGAGVLTGSLSVIADGLDSLFDGLSHVSGFAGLYAAKKPPDAEHPYGHRKFETIAALSIAFLLFITTWQLLESAWERFWNPVPLKLNSWVLVAMGISIIIQALTSYYEHRQGRKLKSEWLVVDSYHSRASILVSISVLVGLGLVELGFPRADPILAGFVAIMIAKIGVDILRETLPVLVDRAAVDPNRIANVVRAVPGVLSFHRVRSRGAEGSAAVDLHLRVSPEQTVQEADAIGSEVRRRLLELDGITDVTIHLEAEHQPQSTEEIYAVLRHSAQELGVRVHEAWVHRMEGHLYLETHIGVDPGLTLGEAHEIAHELERMVRLRQPELNAVHTHIEMAVVDIQEADRVSSELELLVTKIVEEVIENIPEVSSPHNLIIRKSLGQEEGYYLALECTIDPSTPVNEAHQFSSFIEQQLRSRLGGVLDVFVHLEPPGT